jgi:excisionase family DNA binding protein
MQVRWEPKLLPWRPLPRRIGGFLTVEQAAEKVKMHPDTIRRLLRDKQPPGVKLGKRQWRISEDSLKTYLQRSEQAEATGGNE